MKQCDYGCGNLAKFQMSNNKWCCSETRNQCPAVKERNSKACKSSWQKGRKPKVLTKPIWNKGLTKDNSESVKRAADTFKSRCKEGLIKNGFEGKHHTSEALAKIAAAGGIRKGSGRGKKGWYKGYWCDSSWELAWIIYHLDKNIKFERNKTGFEYEFNGTKFRYYPDFIMEDGTFIEVKGYIDQKCQAKLNQFHSSLTILDKRGIKPYLDYAVQTYGKDYIRLYEGQ